MNNLLNVIVFGMFIFLLMSSSPQDLNMIFNAGVKIIQSVFHFIGTLLLSLSNG